MSIERESVKESSDNARAMPPIHNDADTSCVSCIEDLMSEDLVKLDLYSPSIYPTFSTY